MYTLDKKDKIIFEALSKNARISTNELAKLTRLAQPSIIYRIAQLEKNEYISRYDAIINHNKTPFLKFNYFIKIAPNKKEEFEKLFINNKNSTTIYRLITSYNYYILAYFKTKKQLQDFDLELKRISIDFKKYEMQQVEIIPFSLFNLNLKISSIIKKSTSNEKIKIDKSDIKLIKELTNGGGRDSILELSKKTGLKYDFLLYRFKKLIKANYFSLFLAQPGKKFSTIQTDLILFKINNLSFQDVLKKIKTIPQIPYITKHTDDTYLTQILTNDYIEFKHTLINIQERFGENLEHLEIYNTDKWLILNRFPFEWLLN